MKLIFGCGYLGRRVAALWQANGDAVCAVTRSPDRAREWETAGLAALVADVTDPSSLIQLPQATTVLYAVGHDRASGVSQQTAHVEGLRNVLAALPPPALFIYISSTGVYGDCDGEWINEETPCRPLREGGRSCLAAETLLHEHPIGPRAIVLRMAGIYGPGRIPRRAELVAGQPIAAPEHGWLNLIHVDDAAQAVLAAERSAVPPATYLISDGHPVQRGDYYGELARLLGAAPPRFGPAAPESPASQRAGSDKRIDNRRAVSELGLTFQYPSYREGLAAIVRAEKDQT